MSYTPPSANAVNFALVVYTAPTANAVDFELGAEVTVAPVVGVSAAVSVGSVQAFGQASADVAGVEADAIADDLLASGAATSDLLGVDAEVFAGSLLARGAAVADVSGTDAEALAGALLASGGDAPAPPTEQPGGGRSPRLRSRLWRVPDLAPVYLPTLVPEPIKIAARAKVQSAVARARAGSVAARGAIQARAAMAGAAAGLMVQRPRTIGRARVFVRSAVMGARPASAFPRQAAGRFAAGRIRAFGGGFSDEEIVAAVAALLAA